MMRLMIFKYDVCDVQSIKGLHSRVILCPRSCVGTSEHNAPALKL